MFVGESTGAAASTRVRVLHQATASEHGVRVLDSTLADPRCPDASHVGAIESATMSRGTERPHRERGRCWLAVAWRRTGTLATERTTRTRAVLMNRRSVARSFCRSR